jgi:hypothetical protein
LFFSLAIFISLSLLVFFFYVLGFSNLSKKGV